MTHVIDDDLQVNGSCKLQSGVAVKEFSQDGTLTRDSDENVPTEKSVKEYIDKACMIGSENAAWVPCSFEGTNPAAMVQSGEQFDNVGTTDYYPRFTLTLPTNRGGKSLRVAGVRILVQDADANDYVSMTKVLGLKYNTVTAILNTGTDIKSPTREEVLFTAHNCTQYDQVTVTLFCAATSAGQLGIKGVTLKCYYA